MSRVKRGVTAHARHKKVKAKAKGYYGARSRLYKTANQANVKSLQYAFRDRKIRKRDFRRLWIARINAATRELGLSYSKLFKSLKSKNIILNRKILSDLTISDNATFKRIVEIADK